MAEKKIPMRTCIACRAEKPKKELIRVFRKPDGTFVIDLTGKISGRGAYVCNDKKCVEAIIKKRVLNKTFSQEISDDVYAALKESFFGKQ